MTAEERAADVFLSLCEDWDNTPAAECERIIASAIRAAEDEALERAAKEIGRLAEPCADYCEHDYCVAVHDARSKVLACKSTREGK